MASTTFLDLCQRLRAEAGIQGTGPASVIGQTGLYGKLVEWVQVAYSEILRMHPWSFLWARATPSTTNGVALYSNFSITDLGQIYADKFFETTTPGRNRIVYRPFDMLDEAPAASGPPRYFTRRPDGQILLYPTPDAVYALKFDYVRSGHTLSANTDQPLIPDIMLRDAIVYRALSMYGVYNEDGSAKAAGDMQFNMRLTELFEKYGAPLMTQPVALDVEVDTGHLELV